MEEMKSKVRVVFAEPERLVVRALEGAEGYSTSASLDSEGDSEITFRDSERFYNFVLRDRPVSEWFDAEGRLVAELELFPKVEAMRFTLDDNANEFGLVELLEHIYKTHYLEEAVV